MSVSYWWLQAVVPDRQLRALAPSFEKALATLPDQLPVLRTWNQNPDAIVSGPEVPNRLIYEFSDAFWTKELQSFGEGLLELPVGSPDLVAADTVIPASIYWFAVGPAGASELPGRLGAMLIESTAVPAARVALARVLKKSGRSGLFERAQKFYNRGTTHDEDPDRTIETVLGSLPRLLATASHRFSGVITLSMGEP